MQTFLSKLPPHAASLHLTHNEHKASYTPLAAYAEKEWCADAWVSEAQKAKAIAEDSIWELQWYPKTPVGFYKRCACDFEALFEAPWPEG